jgi:hypothetical protein
MLMTMLFLPKTLEKKMCYILQNWIALLISSLARKGGPSYTSGNDLEDDNGLDSDRVEQLLIH